MISILRLSHRYGRDARLTTHCGLVARAFGASEIILSGDEDKKVIESIKKVSKRWGGSFNVKYEKNWEGFIENFKGKRVHLTMYGLSIEKKIKEIKKEKDLLVIIGGEKVPSEVYHIVDYNIAVTNQPHSEVAALAVFLDNYFKGKELNKKFDNAKLKIIPREKGKKVVSLG